MCTSDPCPSSLMLFTSCTCADNMARRQHGTFSMDDEAERLLAILENFDEAERVTYTFGDPSLLKRMARSLPASGY